MSIVNALPLLALLLVWGTARAATADDSSDWLLDDDAPDTRQVNEGELHFLEQAPRGPVHEHENVVAITASSLVDGWTHLSQCHRNLDPVPRSAVVFRAGYVRNLRVTSAQGIGRVWIEGTSVELAEVGHGAHLCLEADSRNLSGDAPGGYVLRSGPFMRRFLDGYYPLHVTMVVRHDGVPLRVADIDPPPQAGFRVRQGKGAVYLDALFEGQLTLRIRFQRDGP